MNKVLVTAFLWAGMIGLVGFADGATKCVALNSSSTTCTGSSQTGVLDWNMTCTTNGKMVAISGVAGCSNQAGASVGAKSDSLTTSNTNGENKYCWCRMISPAVSPWVYVRSTADTDTCIMGCLASCPRYVDTNSAVRSAMFSGLSD